MSATVAFLLIVVGGLVIYEAVQALHADPAQAAATTESGGTSAGAPVPQSAGSVSPFAVPTADVESNVRYLASWAKQNGIDPRVALYLMAHESHGSSDPGTGDTGPAAVAASQNGLIGSYGPLQVFMGQVGLPTYDPNYWKSIEHDIQQFGSRWKGALSGVSYSQFLSNPERYTQAAQGGYWLADNGASADVQDWCTRLGVC